MAGAEEGAVKLSPYPKYRPSGVEWLGETPESWGTKRVSLLARAGAKTFTDGDWVELPYITEDGVRLLQTGNVGIGEYREQGFRYIDESSFSVLRCTEVEPGDVLICRLADPVGRACLAPDLNCRMITSVDVCILKLGTSMDPRYVVYFLSSKVYLDFVESLCRGGTRDRISRSMLGAICAPVPSTREQQSIADFLDRKNSRLDTLVAKKRTLIERLKEKRTALISRTVTRGLPPDAARAAGVEPHPKLKSTGIDWLGAVPEHWEVKPLGRLVRFAGGATPDKGNPEYWDGDIPWVSPKDMKGMRIDDVPNHVSTKGLRNSALTLMREKSVLIVVRGMILAHSFPVAIIDSPVTINQDMKALTSGKRLNAEFLLWLLTGIAHVFVSLADESAHGTRKLESEIVARVRVTLPSTNEQISIVDFLDRETARIDTLVTKIETAIERLQEHRTALITAAVTGKIDVRGTVVREEDAA